MSYTKGKWQIQEDNTGYILWSDWTDDAEELAHINDLVHGDAKANACLIKQAPKLLEALKQIELKTQDTITYEVIAEIVDIAHKAIAKAEKDAD